MKKQIYLDNSKNSYPKPDKVYEAVWEVNRNHGILPSRNSYQMARESYYKIVNVKGMIRRFLGIGKDVKIEFSYSVIMVLYRIIMEMELVEGDVVYLSPFESDALIEALNKIQRIRKFEIKRIPIRNDYSIDVEEFQDACRKQPPKYVFCSYVDGITGYTLPVQIISEICKAVNCRFILDLSLSIGVIPMDLNKLHYDVLVFSGSKALCGPIGTSVVIGKEEQFQEEEINVGLICGLGMGLDNVGNNPETYEYISHLDEMLVNGLEKIQGITVLRNKSKAIRSGIVSFKASGCLPVQMGMILDEDYHIAVGTGCLGYKHACTRMGIGEEGVVQVSVNAFTNESDIRVFLYAIREIMEQY